MTTSIPGPGGDLPVYVARPSGAGPFPGVVVVHDAFGLGDEIRAQADWLAAEGYLAIVPDLFRGRSRVACMRAIMNDTRNRRGPLFADVAAARDWLTAQPDCTGRVGVIGFCMGGGLALLLAPSGDYGAASVNYAMTGPDAYTADALRDACPVVGSFGGSDRALRGAAARLEAALAEAGVDHDVKEYPGVGHAFLNDFAGAGVRLPPLFVVLGHLMGARYDAAAAADARARILAFFARHLGGAAA